MTGKGGGFFSAVREDPRRTELPAYLSSPRRLIAQGMIRRSGSGERERARVGRSRY